MLSIKRKLVALRRIDRRTLSRWMNFQEHWTWTKSKCLRGHKKDADRYKKIAELLEMGGELETALHYQHDLVIPAYKRLSDRWALANAYPKLAAMLSRGGAYDDTIVVYREQAIPAYSKLGLNHSVEICLDRVAFAHLTRFSAECGLALYMPAKRPRQKYSTTNYSSSDLKARLLEVLSHEKTLGTLYQYYRNRSQKILGQSVPDAVIAHSLLAMARIELSCGELEKAKEKLRSSIEPLYQSLNDHIGMNQVHEFLSEISLVQGDWTSAEERLTQHVIPKYISVHQAESVFRAQGLLAAAMVSSGRIDAAIALHQQRYDLAKFLGNPDFQIEAGFNRGSLTIRLSESQFDRDKTATDALDHAEQLALRFDRAGPIGMILQHKADRLYLRKHKGWASLYEAAEIAFRRVGDVSSADRCLALRTNTPTA